MHVALVINDDRFLQFLSLSRDTILFCIDTSSSMHEIPPDGRRKSYFHQALQCALDVMKRKIIICPNDSVGILFFNTARLGLSFVVISFTDAHVSVCSFFVSSVIGIHAGRE